MSAVELGLDLCGRCGHDKKAHTLMHFICDYGRDTVLACPVGSLTVANHFVAPAQQPKLDLDLPEGWNRERPDEGA